MYKFVKRGFDFFVSFCALPFLLPIFLIIAIAIKIDDGGPVLYKGKRIGRKGKIFSMLKFRSMKVNAPDIRMADGSTYNGEDDPRVTKIGKILRKTSLDELPQIINVFLGQMSFVGPRPDSASWLENYTEEEKIILTVRPGITGYNQAINRNAVMTKEKLKNDIYYVKNLSLLFDIKIMIMTVKIVLHSKNVFREKENILIIGAGHLQVPAINKAKEMGYYVGVVDYNEQAEGIEKADEYFNCSTIDIAGVIEATKSFKPNGVMTMATDMPMRTVAAVASQYGIKGLSSDAAFKATDKYEMIKAFEKCNLPIPWFKLIQSKEELAELRSRVPFIVKPCDSSGSRGVYLVANELDMEQAYEYAKHYSTNGIVLAEEYLVGEEVSVEAFMTKGEVELVQITDKITTGAPHFVEMGHIQPSKYVGEFDFLSIVRGIYSAIGLESGPAHIEMMITENGPKIIEMGARLGGDNISSDLVFLSTGVDLVKATISDCMGEDVNLTKNTAKVSIIKYISAPIGKVVSIENADEVRALTGIKELYIGVGVGDKVPEVENSLSRIGYVIACADDKETALGVCDKAIELLKINVEG